MHKCAAHTQICQSAQCGVLSIATRTPLPHAEGLVKFDRVAFDREVGVRLQAWRRKRDLTQEALAEAIGIARATYANLESGRQRVPLDVAWRAAVVLNVSIAQIVPEPLRTPEAHVGDSVNSANLSTTRLDLLFRPV